MTYQWAVIGGGPAGIAAVGQLMDHGVAPQDIAWVDPHFKVGDFGTLWKNVASNTKVELFLKFLQACRAFEYSDAPIDFDLNHLPKNKTCELHYMGLPLQWVSDRLKSKVNVYVDFAETLSLKNRTWEIKLREKTIAASNVIMAIGAEAKTLDYHSAHSHIKSVPLHMAMDRQSLQQVVAPSDTVAVFGSSHSAILALRHLVEMGTKQIINFYRSTLLYAVYLSDWILFDDTGLKGPTAEWARDNIDGVLPANLLRVYSNADSVARHLPQCNKVIYAVGFKRRSQPCIVHLPEINYIEQAGIIAPGLFGFGIGFPESKVNPIGILEYRVGLWKFMDYIQRVLPIWLKYST